MLTSLRFQNFRGFRDLRVDGIKPVTLITGANNTGKTGLLEAILWPTTGTETGERIADDCIGAIT